MQILFLAQCRLNVRFNLKMHAWAWQVRLSKACFFFSSIDSKCIKHCLSFVKSCRGAVTVTWSRLVNALESVGGCCGVWDVTSFKFANCTSNAWRCKAGRIHCHSPHSAEFWAPFNGSIVDLNFESKFKCMTTMHAPTAKFKLFYLNLCVWSSWK